MTVRLRFFASLRERVGCSEATWELNQGATVDDLWKALCLRYPQLAPLSSSVTFAVNREYVRREHTLAHDDEIALIPPVSGGLDVSDCCRAN